MNTFRLIAACAIGFLLMLCVSTVAVVLSPMAIISRFVGFQNPVPYVCSHVFWLYDIIVRRCILNIKLCHAPSDMITPHSGDVFVIMANHPNMTLLFSTPGFLWHTGIRRYAAVVKGEFVTSPLLAWLGIPAQICGFAVPIQRNERKKALKAIGSGIKRLPYGNGPIGLVIYPDGSRPTRQKIAESWNRYTEKAETDAPMQPFTHTLVPKSGGINTLIDALNTQRQTPRTLSVTIATNRPMARSLWQEIYQMIDGTVTVEVREVTPVILKHHMKGTLPAWLVEEWQRKHAILATGE